MTYPENFQVKIGFDRIVQQIGSLCTMERGRQVLLDQTFSSSQQQIEHRQILGNQMRSAMMMESDSPRSEFVDMTPMIAKASIEGSFLETDEIVALKDALDSLAETVAFVDNHAATYLALAETAVGIDDYRAIANHIDSLVDRFGKIKDSASPELYEIRRSLRSYQGQVSKRLQSVLSAAQSAGWADADATISIRDGRAVIPVSAVNKRKIDGFILDTSATGKTFYIEPVEVVEINNTVRELEYSERREVVKILSDFTDSLRPESEGLTRAAEFMALMDMLRAKARWASSNSAVMPLVSIEGRLNLRQARHPLLQQTLAKEGKQIVPLDMTLDRKERIMIISGPNAGGKSVCLKTVGLLQYMFQCGFPIPVLENSEMPVFDSIFIDIGDEQSIDNDLSTYSSHLTNMKNMLAGATDSSLVLIDEFGSGTEPVIGGAIAESILERLVEKQCYGVITTHYSNIKYYASNTDGIVNGAMMFDVQNIRPLFRLESGKPGSSFAIEIARNIGLPESIIASASAKMGSDHLNLERQLRLIARDRHYWEQKRERIRITDRRVEEMEQDYATRLSELKRERSEIIKAAKAEAKEILAETNRQIENTIRTIKESQAEKEATRTARSQVEKLRERIESNDDSSAERQERINREMERIEQRRQRRRQRKNSATEPSESTAEQVKATIEVGSKVRLSGQDTAGEVTAIKGRKATVAFGSILTTIDTERLEVISNNEYKRQTRPVTARTVIGADISERKLNFKQNIDVRGMRAAEALDAVSEFMDYAIMLGVEQVRILHGKGTGALKQEIRNYLRSLPDVERAEDEDIQQGGAGITVVKLRS